MMNMLRRQKFSANVLFHEIPMLTIYFISHFNLFVFVRHIFGFFKSKNRNKFGKMYFGETISGTKSCFFNSVFGNIKFFFATFANDLFAVFRSGFNFSEKSLTLMRTVLRSGTPFLKSYTTFKTLSKPFWSHVAIIA